MPPGRTRLYADNAARQRAYRAREAPRRAQRTRKVYHLSQTDEWETPQPFFDQLHAEFGFTLDVAATAQNAKCVRYFTKDDDGLARDWGQEICWMNPPFKQSLDVWMHKAFESAQAGALVVCLVPSRTDRPWWRAYAMRGECRFVEGRLKFGGSPYNAPFPNAIIIFRPPMYGDR